MADISLNELIDMLSELFTNMNNLDKTYYDMFYNQTPMDITLERYDEEGILHTYEVPNRAKDKDNVIIGEGNPEGEVPASIGKLYIDTVSNYLYYKTEGTVEAPTSTGWITILTSESIGSEYQSKSEKGQPNGYASLGPDGKVVKEQLPKANLTYAETSEYIVINIILQTVLTIVSSNTNLEIENNYTGTMSEVGTITRILTEETLEEYVVNENVASLTGEIDINNVGVATGFSSTNYIDTNLKNTELVFTTGNRNEQEETLCVVDDRSITIQPSETTLDVVADPETLVIENNYDGRKPIGIETVLLEYKDAVVWDDNISTVEGSLDISTPEVSGFSALSYIIPTISSTSPMPLIISFNTSDEIQEGQVLIGSPMSIAIKDGYLGYNKYSLNEFEPIIAVEANTKYYVKIYYDSTNQTSIVSYSLDGSTWTQIIPEEDNGLFIINSYIIGKGQLDGQSNVPFLGTVNSLETYIEEDGTPNYFASIVGNWYEDNLVVELGDYDLVLTSGIPEAGNTLNLTYTTTYPMIGSESVELNTEYRFRWNNTSVYTFVPQLYKNDEWVTIGSELSTAENTLEFTKGLFYGSINLSTSTTMNSDLETTQQYSDVGDVTYNLAIASGFSQDNYLIMDTPIVDGDLLLNITTGVDVTTQQVLVENNYNSLQTALTIDTGKLHYIIDGTDYETNLTVVDANTNYLFKFTRTSGAWTASFSTDGDTWTILSANSSTSFDDLFKDTSIDMFKVFDGTVNVGESTVTTTDGVVPMFVQERVDIGDTETLLTTEYKYNWYEDGTLVDLADYDIVIISGTPESGDTLTLTYVTTEAG